MRNRPASTCDSESCWFLSAGSGTKSPSDTVGSSVGRNEDAASSCSARSLSTSAHTLASEQRSFRNEDRFAATSASAASNSAFTASRLSCRVAMDGFYLSVEPGLGHAPNPFHRLGGDPQQIWCLLHGESAKKPRFHDLALPIIQLGQPICIHSPPRLRCVLAFDSSRSYVHTRTVNWDAILTQLWVHPVPSNR